MKSRIALPLLFAALIVHADSPSCPVLAGNYCCGTNSGDIQSCIFPKYVEQQAIPGGQKYSIYDSRRELDSVWMADGVSRYYKDELFEGMETIACDGNGISWDVPHAVLVNRPEAKGFFRGGLYLKPSGELVAPAHCIFTAPDGHQVFNCGLKTGYTCFKDSHRP